MTGAGAVAIATETKFSLGLGLTNECNLACSFCYRDPTRTDRLGLADVEALLDRLPVRTINLGTGENGMHPEFGPILAHLRARDDTTKLTITSNGYSIAVLPAQRGARLGIGVTIIAVVMRTNFDRLAAIAAVAKALGAPLRLNVYQAVRTDTFALTYEEYWTAVELLFAQTDVIAIGEPLVRAMAGMAPRKGGCGVSTVRVTPRGTVQPCVYWPGGGAPMQTLLDEGPAIVATAPFEQVRSTPEACLACAYLETCGGGCAGRRRLMGRIDQPDPYCPIVRGGERPLEVRLAPARELGKLESACTTIVVAR